MLTDDWEVELQADVLQQFEAVHICNKGHRLSDCCFMHATAHAIICTMFVWYVHLACTRPTAQGRSDSDAASAPPVRTCR
jgi:hypothetical protein